MLPIGSRLIGSEIYNAEKEVSMTEINKKVGTNIRKYRVKKGWTQEKLAFKANLHRAYIGQIERGEKNIGLKNLEKIANSLGIKVTDLLK